MGQEKSRLAEKTDDVKRQIGDGESGEKLPIYQLLSVKGGGGKLIDLMKESRNSLSAATFFSQDNSSSNLSSKEQSSNDYVDSRIVSLVKPFLYNEGRGKMISLRKLALVRYGCSRELIQSCADKKHQTGQVNTCTGNNSEEERLVCWKLEERGYVGETALHICFLVSTTTHMSLARRLVKLFPALVNDIYTSEVFFGESPIHMSIVHEDVAMLKTLLKHGANVHERCLGDFFLCEDQKNIVNDEKKKTIKMLKRCESKKQIDIDLLYTQMKKFNYSSNEFQTYETNYLGHCNWGEYPASFAVYLNLEDCFRLLLAAGANPNRQDSNGNTSLHIAVISNKIDMFDLCYASGGDIRARNKQNLTPLMLAAKLEKLEMFFHILEIQRQVNWIFCNTAFIDIPIDEIDSISTTDGKSIDESALAIVVFGSSTAHLKMLDGFLGQLLTVKWQTSQKNKFFSMLCHFFIIFITSILTYVTRSSSSHIKPIANTTASSFRSMDIKEQLFYISTSSEICLIVLILIYLQNAFMRTLLGSSLKTLPKTIRLSPEMSLFFVTSLLIIVCIPMRLMKYNDIDDALSAFIVFSLPLKFLFFCRAFRSVGPFVLMIYKIIVNDLLCFAIIMLIFVFGFSLSFSIIFKSHTEQVEHTIEISAASIITTSAFFNNKTQTNNEEDANNQQLSKNYFDNFLDGIISMHLMALNEFGMVFEQFEHTQFPNLSKFLFLIYMILVSILLINMLIAMLGKTYQEIASQPNENLRQWARTLLMVERSWRDKDKLKSLYRYCGEKLIEIPRADVDGKMKIVTEKCRYYSTTWALKSQDKLRIDFIRSLIDDNLKNSYKIARKQSYEKTFNCYITIITKLDGPEAKIKSGHEDGRIILKPVLFTQKLITAAKIKLVC